MELVELEVYLLLAVDHDVLQLVDVLSGWLLGQQQL